MSNPTPVPEILVFVSDLIFYSKIEQILEKSGKGCLVTFQDIGVKMYKPGKKRN